MIFNELKQTLRIVARLALILGVLLSFFAVMELIRAYLTLRELHPFAGYTFLAVLVIAFIWSVMYFLRAFNGLPRTISPVARENPKKFIKYLAAYLDRLAINESLSDEQRQQAQAAAEKAKQALATKKQDTISMTIETIETETITPLLESLDTLADQKIRTGTRDIMFAVTLSPYRSVDLLVVLYRNISMVKNIALVYNARPSLRESFRIMIDTARVVAAVNFVNLGGKMAEKLTRGLPGIIPGVSRIVDDCAEGLAAGLFTSITGHAAKDRCRAFRKWDYEEARSKITSHLKTFTSDVGKMFFKDIIPSVRIPGGLSMDKWHDMKNSIQHGFNETIDAIHNFVRPRRKRHADQAEG